MNTKITGEQQVQILSPNFSISPSNEDYVLNISANGKDFSPLFAVRAGVTRLVSNVAPGSYYKLVGNHSDVVINWQRMCATEGGASGRELLPVTEFPLTAEDGTVVSLVSGDTKALYQYDEDSNEWSEVSPDLSAYWTSAETQSAITAVEDHLFDVEQVTASALTELHDDILELSARTVDLSPYYTSAQTEDAIDEAISAYTPTTNFATINGSAITNGGDIVIQGGGDMSDYWTSAQTKTYVDSGITIVQNQIDTMDNVVSAALIDLNDTKVGSADIKHIVKLTQAQYDALTDKDPYTFYIIISNS